MSDDSDEDVPISRLRRSANGAKKGGEAPPKKEESEEEEEDDADDDKEEDDDDFEEKKPRRSSSSKKAASPKKRKAPVSEEDEEEEEEEEEDDDDDDEEEDEDEDEDDAPKKSSARKKADSDDSDDDVPISQLVKKKEPAEKEAPKKKKKKKSKEAAEDQPAPKKVKKAVNSGLREGSFYESLRGALVQALLRRWWYAIDWPAADVVDRKPEKDFEEMPSFPGVHVCTAGPRIGAIIDYRDHATSPCFANLYQKPSAELKDLLLKAYNSQIEALVAAKGECAYAQKLRKELAVASKVNTQRADNDAVRAVNDYNRG